MGTKSNITGTTNNSFCMGKGVPVTLFKGDESPTENDGKDGDIFIKQSSPSTILQKKDGEWKIFGTRQLIRINTSQTIIPTHLEEIILVDTTDNQVEIVIPSTNVYTGTTMTFKDVLGTNNSSKNIKITLDDNSASVTLDARYGAMTIIYNGDGWTILNNYTGTLTP